MTQEEIDALRKAEDVAMRLQGKRQFKVFTSETVTYCRTLWADDSEEAEAICNDECDYGEACDYNNWQFDFTEEVK